jgi:hypothetical protein
MRPVKIIVASQAIFPLASRFASTQGESWNVADVEDWLRGVNRLVVQGSWPQCDLYFEELSGKTKGVEKRQLPANCSPHPIRRNRVRQRARER